MNAAKVQELVRWAEELSDDDKLELAQRLIERARHHGQEGQSIDLNALAGTLMLDEDPLAIQERMRSEGQ